VCDIVIIMITIQQLHKYNNLVVAGVAPEIICPLDGLHGHMTPWFDDKEQSCFWCLGCNTKLYLSDSQENFIMNWLRQ
jgi:hypothetical protein